MADNGQNRVFHYAVLASLALHALLLFGFPDLIDTARRAVSLPPTLIARLMEPAPAPAPAPAETVPVKRVEAAKAVPRLAKPDPQPAAPATPEIKAEEPAVQIEASAAPAAIAAPPSLAVAEPQRASPPQQAAQAPESLSRDQYRVQLIDEARRHKRYPPLARENNWQGDVLVGVAIAPNGRPSVTLKGSSGYEVLDRQALEMFRQAARAVPVPPALRGKEFALDVRAVYGLEE